MAGTRSYVAGNFFFNLDGVKCGFVKAVDGGDITADVIEEKTGPSAFVKKHVGPPRYGELELTIGFSLAQTVYDWLQATLERNYSRKDGSIVAADLNLQAKSSREFFHALVTEIGFPALDGSAKDPAYLTVKFAPELIRNTKATGKLTAGKAGKQFLPSNFRLELDGLDCTKVSKIDAFTIKQSVQTDDIGDARDYEKEPGKLDFPNLTVTLAEVSAQTWLDWFEDFVIKGDNGDAKEKSGAIVFLAPDRKAELGRVILHNVGIFALRSPAQTAGTDKVARIVAELYCERMELRVGKPLPQKPPAKPPLIERKPIPIGR